MCPSASFLSLITSHALVSHQCGVFGDTILMTTERVNLCLHLLRLRPTPAQLKEWNKSSIEAHHTHATKGWTEFLRELAPPSIFDEARELDGDKIEERKKLLAQIYDLAKREEDYLNGEIGMYHSQCAYGIIAD